MMGVVYIERENSDGDRKIVRTIDVEGLSVTEGDPMEIIKVAVRDAMVEPAAYAVRAIHDSGWNSRVIHSLTVNDTRRARCPVCGGLNPGDASHTRCM